MRMRGEVPALALAAALLAGGCRNAGQEADQPSTENAVPAGAIPAPPAERLGAENVQAGQAGQQAAPNTPDSVPTASGGTAGLDTVPRTTPGVAGDTARPR